MWLISTFNWQNRGLYWQRYLKTIFLWVAEDTYFLRLKAIGVREGGHDGLYCQPWREQKVGLSRPKMIGQKVQPCTPLEQSERATAKSLPTDRIALPTVPEEED